MQGEKTKIEAGNNNPMSHLAKVYECENSFTIINEEWKGFNTNIKRHYPYVIWVTEKCNNNA